MGSIGFSSRERRAFTLTDVCVVLAGLLLLLAVTPVVRQHAFEGENRMKCARNLTQIFAAMTTYANANNGNYPRTYRDYYPNSYRPRGPLNDYTGVNSIDSFNPGGPGPNDTSASIFLLMKSTGYPMEILVCPGSDALPYDPQLCGPVLQRSNFPSRQYLSYSMQSPFPTANAIVSNWQWNAQAISTGTPIFSDMNPGTPVLATLTPTSSTSQMQAGNSQNHGGRGQNVLYGDKSVMWQTSPFCGPARVNPAGIPENDNIYTSNTSPPTVGGWPQDNLDAVMLPLATTGLQPPARSKYSPEMIGIAGVALLVVVVIVVLVVVMTRKRPPLAQSYSPSGGPPPPLPPPPRQY